jgi:alpha/beta superfamily hydrolase
VFVVIVIITITIIIIDRTKHFFHKKPAHVKLLLEFGADPRLKYRGGNTPLDDLPP